MDNTIKDENYEITHMDLFVEWLTHKHLKRSALTECLVNFVQQKRNVNSVDELVKERIEKFIKNVEGRWKKYYNNSEKFKIYNREWLNTEVFFEKDNVSPTSSKLGRPSKEFENCGKRSKLQKVKKLTERTSLEELSLATQVSLRKCGKRSVVSVFQDLSSSPNRAKKYKNLDNNNSPLPYTPEEALGLIINARLSKSQYLQLRSSAMRHNTNIYPSWKEILKAKNKCYPEQSEIQVSEFAAEIKLKALLHMTAKRLCELQESVLSTLPNETRSLTLICKWGCDGSSGHSNYKQRFCSEGVDDSSVFMISFVPLRLILDNKSDNSTIIWQNSTPSSTRFCRAIKFIFAKETPELATNETNAIQRQIDELPAFVFNDKFTVNFKMILTMIDGKICNILAGNKSTQMCYICKAKPVEMNNLENIGKKAPSTEYYSFGLSTLHSWIRFFECCLHVCYRLDVKTWQVRGEENKRKVEDRKKEIIEKLRKNLGILVDQPKPGYGSTNDGNTARTFFKNPELSSSITGLNAELIKRFAVILQTISCGYEINTKLFDHYTKETAKLFVALYPWYNMPASVHKVLFHGSEIIGKALLPIGQLSEEAQESKNKEFKFIREHHTRKHSRIATNEDLLRYFILSSDPKISQSANSNRLSKKQKLLKEALHLLSEPLLTDKDTIYSSDSDSDSNL